MSRTNKLRARMAEQALAVTLDDRKIPNYEEAIIDLIANLGHFADWLGLDYLQLTATAIGHWKAEQHGSAEPLAPAVTITIDNESHPK